MELQKIKIAERYQTIEKINQTIKNNSNFNLNSEKEEKIIVLPYIQSYNE